MKNMKTVHMVAGCFVFMAVVWLPIGAAFAVEPGWYGSLGLSNSDFSEDDFDEVCRELELECSSDSDQFGYRVGLGYKINPYFSIEAGWSSYGDVKVGPSGFGGLSADLDGFYASLFGEIPLGQGGFSLLGEIGIAYLDWNISVSLPGDLSDSVSEKVTAPVYGLGGVFNSSGGGFSMRLMWERVDPDKTYRIGFTSIDSPSVDVISLVALFRFGG